MKRISGTLMVMILIGLLLTSCNTNTKDEMQDASIANGALETEVEDITNETEVEVIDENDAEIEVPEIEETESAVIDVSTPEENEVISVDYQALYQSHQVNEVGHILVVMYHGIKDDPPYHRTSEDFLKDLEFMYENGYRLISMADYFNNEIDVPLGTTPILLTFDDGLSSTFSLEATDGSYQVNPDTAVGILEAFIAQHPDFGRGAVFFINNNGESTFSGAGTLEERLHWLVEKGYDIGNHTANHLDLAKLSGETVQSEIGKVHQVIQDKVSGYQPIALSYPFGIRPSETNRVYALNGHYEGNTYNYYGGFAVGPTSWYYPPNHVSFDPYLIARTRGSEGEFGDLWYYFDYYEKHPEKKYISDGDSTTTVIPIEALDFVEEDQWTQMTIITYEPLVVGDAQ